MDEFGFDGTQDFEEWADASNQLLDASQDAWHTGDEYWLANSPELANDFYYASASLEELSTEAYANAWEAYNGPINAEGYTAHDASLGYTTSDTSLIEPASAASSASLISTNDATSVL